MTLIKRSPTTIGFAIILSILITLPLSDIALGKRRAASTRQKASRTQKGKKVSARERRSGRRSSRLSARNNRRGRSRGRVRQMSARDRRRQRQLIAREQSSALKALERRLRRPLSRRERTAELRRIAGRHRRDREIARRRAEAARRAAIARQRALEQAMRNEAQGFIARDNTIGEDPEVRRAAVKALGNHAGTVVVMDPMTGRIYSAVNQEWAFRRGFKPCSTIKLVTGLAGLNEKVINPMDTAAVSDRYRIDLTDALAYSNNTYFQQVGGKIGFDKMVAYAKELGLGERTGINAANEYPGQVPTDKAHSLGRMWSHGDDFEVTPLQLATLVSAMTNGGKLLAPRVPQTPQEMAKFKPVVRRELSIDQDNYRRMVPGMVGAVNYGSGKKAYDPLQTVAGKTGTCIGEGSWLGLFTSYAPLANPRLAVVVIARGSDGRRHFPAAVAGQIYRELNRRFGTPVNLQIATTPPGGADDSKAAELNEEEKDAAAAEAAEAAEIERIEKAAEAAESEVNTTQTAAAPTQTNTAPATGTATPRSTVKPVLKQIERQNPESQRATPKPGTVSSTAPSTAPPASKPQPNTSAPPDVRPRRALP
ncbi:MAG: penicillin-binding transpeptidase domain-containing protein [Pyrinomonadaceae bacterium]